MKITSLYMNHFTWELSVLKINWIIAVRIVHEHIHRLQGRVVDLADEEWNEKNGLPLGWFCSFHYKLAVWPAIIRRPCRFKMSSAMLRSKNVLTGEKKHCNSQKNVQRKQFSGILAWLEGIFHTMLTSYKKWKAQFHYNDRNHLNTPWLLLTFKKEPLWVLK